MKKVMIKMMISALILATLLMSGCTKSFNLDFNFSSNKIKLTDEAVMSLPSGDATKLEIKNVTGGIYVSKSSGDQVSVKFEKKVNGQVEEEAQSVMDEIQIFAKEENSKLTIKAVTKDGTDFWKWKQQNHPMMNVSVDFYVTLPTDLESYDVTLITGNIEIEDLSGSFVVNDTTGNVTLSNVVMNGDNKVKLITGNIMVKSDIANANELSINNVTGNVTLSLPEDANATLNISLTTGNIDGSLLGKNSTALGGTNVDKVLGNGKTKITIDNTTGNISVNKK